MNKVTDISISREADSALHSQLYTALYRLIGAGQWRPGSQIPSETQLSTHLNISRSTVRLALQHAEIEGLIKRSAGRGTFVTNSIKQQVSPQLIAFITNWSEQGSHKKLLTGAEAVASEHNYRIIFCNSRNPQEEAELLQNLIADNIAGVLLWANANSSDSYAPVFDIYKQQGVPIVCMDRSIGNGRFDCITSNNYDSAYHLMSHLLDLGHQRIIFLSHRQMAIQSVQERYRAYQDAMRQAGLEPQPPWLIGSHNHESSEALENAAYYDQKNAATQDLRRLLTSASHPNTALFAVNNLLALLAIRVINHLDMQIPDDISVACFDDLDGLFVTVKPMTTIVQDMHTIGERAAQRLIKRIEGYSGSPIYDEVPSQLMIRQSTSVPVNSIID